MTYSDSWGKILGRDVCKACRFCLDGIGEFADIACGDAWYLLDDNRPNFTEREGRNIIFARTHKGNELIQKAYQAGHIDISVFDSYKEELEYIQKYQFDRRTTMGIMLAAMRIFHKSVPKYDKNVMRKFSKNIVPAMRLRRFFGTIKRIMENRI